MSSVRIAAGGIANDYTADIDTSIFVLSMKLQRKAGFYIIVYHIPSFAIAALAIIGWKLNGDILMIRSNAGLFIPTQHTLDREEKCTLGLTALFTKALKIVDKPCPQDFVAARTSGSCSLEYFRACKSGQK